MTTDVPVIWYRVGDCPECGGKLWSSGIRDSCESCDYHVESER